MTIALMIQPRGVPPDAARLVPVATHDVFRRYWLPMCANLQLTWIPLFETGFPLLTEDISEVLTELRRFRDCVNPQQSTNGFVDLDRINRLIGELERLDRNTEVDLYIG